MRILLNVRIPHEPFNTLVREGKAGDIIKEIIKESIQESGETGHDSFGRRLGLR